MAATAPAAPLSTHDTIVSGAATVKKAAGAGGTSTVRSTVGGAAGGAATGAALGSLVPGVGTAAGAGAGAVAGGTGGALHARAAKRAARAAAGPGRQVLIAEFVVCVVILALSPLTDKHRTDGPAAFMRRGSALCGLFLILALASTGGRGAAKVAAGFGALVTVSLIVSSRDIFVTLAQKLGSTKTGPAGPPEGLGEAAHPGPDSQPQGVAI